MQTQLLIEGKLVTGEGEKQPVYNPATGDPAGDCRGVSGSGRRGGSGGRPCFCGVGTNHAEDARRVPAEAGGCD